MTKESRQSASTVSTRDGSSRNWRARHEPSVDSPGDEAARDCGLATRLASRVRQHGTQRQRSRVRQLRRAGARPRDRSHAPVSKKAQRLLSDPFGARKGRGPRRGRAYSSQGCLCGAVLRSGTSTQRRRRHAIVVSARTSVCRSACAAQHGAAGDVAAVGQGRDAVAKHGELRRRQRRFYPRSAVVVSRILLVFSVGRDRPRERPWRRRSARAHRNKSARIEPKHITSFADASHSWTVVSIALAT